MGAQAVWLGRHSSPHEGRVVRLKDREALRLGRAPECDLVLEDRVVSSIHVELRRSGGELRARDLESLNGTYLKVSGDAERRLDPGEEVVIPDEACLRIGPYLITPCVRISDRVSLGGAPLQGTPTDPDPDSRDDPASGPEAPGVHGTAATLLERIEGAPVPESLLASLVEMAGADRGHLLARNGDRFLMLASSGNGGEICLSRSFLRNTSARDRTWLFRAGATGDDDAPKSLLTFPEGTLLIGVPILGRRRRVVAVAHLEAIGATLPGHRQRQLDELARTGGPLLELCLERDREARARQAAESALLERGRLASTAPAEPGRAPQLVGKAPRFREAVERVRRAAPTSSTILLRGESGTGKEELAHFAHATSPRASGPFVALNGACLPRELVESELFGHDAGAFTGADTDRAGAFERADGGTLFLDEVGDLPLSVQASLLRVIECGEVVRVGGSVHVVDVRLVAATHRDLEQLVAAGAFRQDLYYRLRVIEVSLPRLADRVDDILPLAEHFLEVYARPDGSLVHGISASAATALTRYRWPGNVRELRNVIERAVVLDEDGVLDSDDLPPEIVESADGGTRDSLELLLCTEWHIAKKRFEEIYFRRALENAGGGVQAAADRTGVTRRLMTLKIKALNLRETDLPEGS